ncbi:MAG: hypothetical protein HY814_09820 [Candidatus Riflebacteria bacterium]|nr:hypothetical protein [Candidatus Riflebacteria bacterium]
MPRAPNRESVVESCEPTSDRRTALGGFRVSNPAGPQEGQAEPNGRRHVLAWAATFLVLAAVMANTWAYLTLSSNALDTGQWASEASLGSRWWHEGGPFRGFARWLDRQHYYPPLYFTWLAGGCTPGERPDLTALVMWSNLWIVAGLVGLTAALLRRGAGPATIALAQLLLAGAPLLNWHTKALAFECGLVGTVGLALALLAGPHGLPSRRGSAILGVVLGLGALTKWTVALYLVGPLGVALASFRRAGGTWKEGALRLGLVALVATLVAGWWFWSYLDWDLLRLTTANDPTVIEASRVSEYGQMLGMYTANLWTACGRWLSPLVLAGALLALWKRPAGTGPLAASFAGALLLLSVFRHGEARYLVPALVPLAGLAAHGFGALGRRPAIGAAFLAAGLAVAQAADATWYHRDRLQPMYSPGHYAASDPDMRMRWTSRAGWDLYEKARLLAHALALPGETLHLAVHPLNTHPALDVQLFSFLNNSQPAPHDRRWFLGYESSIYCTFLEDEAHDRIAFLAMSKTALQGDRELALALLDMAWIYVHPGGSPSHCTGLGRPDDPFLLDRLRERYRLLETVPDPQGEVWLLIRRDLLARLRGDVRVGPLPRSEAPTAPSTSAAGGGA